MNFSRRMELTAKVIALARRDARRAPMETIGKTEITEAGGLAGDFKGAKHKTRQITILAKEDWSAALADLPIDARALPWTTRRANILIERLRLPRVKGAILAIGDIQLEVTGQTYPCRRMDEAYPGLLKALAPDWRGGVTCRVLTGGLIDIGDEISIQSSPAEPPPRILPG